MVRITEDARKCSLFLGFADSQAKSLEDVSIVGTGFCVTTGGPHLYLITAAHVADNFVQEQTHATSKASDPFVVCLTGPDGLIRLDHLDNVLWYYSSDISVDVAIMRYDYPDWARNTCMHVDDFISDRHIEHWNIGPGDAVYAVGLFRLHTGKDRSLPIVYSGNIALMPSDQRIPVKDGKSGRVDEVEAYLVELGALEGASGSPVTVRPTIQLPHQAKDALPAAVFAESREFLLGVWTAAWPGRPDKALSKSRGIRSDSWVPVGMGLVVPASKIYDLLMRDDVKDERSVIDVTWKRSRAASTTAIRIGPPGGNLSHREDFTSLLNAAAKTKPQADQTLPDENGGNSSDT